MQKIALGVAGFIFLLVAVLHLVRAFFSVAIYVGSTLIPVFVSWIGAPVCFALAAWMFTVSRK